jgi:DNA-binding PadR family transcriptional regulator
MVLDARAKPCKGGAPVLTLAVLGFLAEEPLHAYELRRRISDLMGHARPVSDGALYPALNRMQKAGLLARHAEASGAGPTRQVFTLTADGRAELLRRLGEPTDIEISDGSSFFTLLAFLSHLPDAAAQARVLRRRLAFLAAPAGFFHEDGRPLRAAEATDRYRKGMLVMARAQSKAERDWLTSTLAELEA